MRFLRVFLFPTLFLALAQPLHAETPSDVPNPLRTNRSWVADNANVLSDNDERRINAILSPLERRNGAEVAVVTVKNLGGLTVEQFANELFRLWKIGKKGKDNGVVILAAIDDRKLRIDVDYGLQDILTDGQTGEILRGKVTPQFKKGAYGEGLVAGALAVAQKIDPSTVAPAAGSSNSETLPDSAFAPGATVAPVAGQPSAGTSASSPNTSNGSSFFSDLLWILFGLFLGCLPFIFFVLILWWIIKWFRRPKRCPKCKTVMVQLPDAEEARSLSPVQMFEQKIGALDYKVWQCPNCHTEEISTHTHVSNYEKCPQCHNMTALSSARVIKAPTESTLGYQEVTVTCQWPQCGHTGSFRRTMPRLERQHHHHHHHGSNAGDYAAGSILGSTWGSSNSSSDSGGWSSSSSSSSYDSSSSSSFDSGPSDFGGSDSGGGGGGASDSW